MSTITSSLSPHGVATLTLNRPDKHNALNAQMLRELHARLVEVAGNAAVRVVVLTGAGASFCAGADIAYMRSMLDVSEQENTEDALLVARCMRTLDELDRPVIARVNGNVFGGGIGLVACADIAIATRSATFALSEVRLGLVPATISPFVIAAIGARQARRLFLTAERFDASEAQSIGLVHRVVAPEDLDEHVERCVDALLAGGPHAQRAAKSLIRSVTDTGDRDAQTLSTARLLTRLRTSEEGREGLSAFLERRRPRWTRSE